MVACPLFDLRCSCPAWPHDQASVRPTQLECLSLTYQIPIFQQYVVAGFVFEGLGLMYCFLIYHCELKTDYSVLNTRIEEGGLMSRKRWSTSCIVRTQEIKDFLNPTLTNWHQVSTNMHKTNRLIREVCALFTIWYRKSISHITSSCIIIFFYVPNHCHQHYVIAKSHHQH